MDNTIYGNAHSIIPTYLVETKKERITLGVLRV